VALNFCAWWFAITLVWWERVRRPGHEFLPNGLPLMGFSMALVINTLMGSRCAACSSLPREGSTPVENGISYRVTLHQRRKNRWLLKSQVDVSSVPRG
jgi:hypothetical protein